MPMLFHGPKPERNSSLVQKFEEYPTIQTLEAHHRWLHTDAFSLTTDRRLQSNGRAYHCLACFPWTTWSLAALWGGHALSFPELKARWDETAGRWSGAVAVGGTGCIHVFEKMAAVQPLEVTLPEVGTTDHLASNAHTNATSMQSDAEVQNITWAISSVEPVKPLLVFTITSVILILDVTSCAIIGRLRGHGGVRITTFQGYRPTVNTHRNIAANHLFVGASDSTPPSLYDIQGLHCSYIRSVARSRAET